MIKRPHFQKLIDDLNLLGCLAEFSPTVIGTPPLGLATEESDIDIACAAGDPERFANVARACFGQLAAFSLKRFEDLDEPAIVASFVSAGWVVELFCQSLDIQDQAGVRHFLIEQRLLGLRSGLRLEILRLKRLGFKTEPAFARALRLPGDPYLSMLALEAKTDEELRRLITDASQTFRQI